MKRTINLLPPVEQKKLKTEKLITEVLNFSTWVVVSLVLFCLLSYGTVLYLKHFSGSLDAEILIKRMVLDSTDNTRIKNEVQTLNTALKDFQNLEAQHYEWSVALIALAEIIPGSIQLNAVSLDRASGKVEIVGVATDREAVIALWVNLKRSDFFKDVNFPLTNLEKPQITPFSYTFFINPEKIKSL